MLQESFICAIANFDTAVGRPIIILETKSDPDVEYVKVHATLLCQRKDSALMYRSAFNAKQDLDIEAYMPDLRAGERDRPPTVAAEDFTEFVYSTAVGFFAGYERLAGKTASIDEAKSPKEMFDRIDHEKLRELFLHSANSPLTVRTRAMLSDRALTTALKTFIRGCIPGGKR